MNQDFLQRFPNQAKELRGTECVGETVSDLIGNLTKQPMDAGFSYAASLRVMNRMPTTAGSDPYAGMLSGVIYGALPTEDVPFDVALFDELYEANWANYPLVSKQLAALFARNGVISFNSYQDVVYWLSQNKGGVSLSLRWYQNFNQPQSNGLLTEPSGSFVYHNAAVYDAPSLGLLVKPWLGGDYGVKGYAYLNERTFNEVFLGAYAFHPGLWKWLQLAYIGVSRPYLLGDILPLMSHV